MMVPFDLMKKKLNGRFPKRYGKYTLMRLFGREVNTMNMTSANIFRLYINAYSCLDIFMFGSPRSDISNGRNACRRSEPCCKDARMLSPDSEARLRLNDKINVSLVPEKEQNPPDSIKIFFDGNAVATLTSASWECTEPATLARSTGRKPVKAVAYKNGKTQIITRYVVLRAVIEPLTQLTVVNTYPMTGMLLLGLLFSDGYYMKVLARKLVQHSGSRILKLAGYSGTQS
jgi:hypothetical protein